MAWAIKQQAPTNSKFLLLLLANYADDEDKCWPSVARLAKETGMARSTVHVCLNELSKLGFIRIEPRKAEGVHLPNMYCLITGQVVREPDGVVRLTEGGSPVNGPKPIIEPIIEISNTNTRACARGDFDEFWKVWPHKVGKPAALKAYTVSRRNGHCQDVILEGVKSYIAGKPPERPWLNPATFLNQERFLDQPAAAPAQAKEREFRNTPDSLLNNNQYWIKRRQLRADEEARKNAKT